MRTLTTILLLFTSIFVAAQEKDKGQQKEKWQRVYTYEDSVIELSLTNVILVNNDISRVIFRTVWSKPQSIREKPGVKYKTRLETIECKCKEWRYRIYQVTLLDSKGNPVDSYDMDQTEEWTTAKPGGIMERMIGTGCRLVAEKRSYPKSPA